ncbi:MAG: OmpA family protein, partial [Alphaproteobacteria bacterium]|nr:OmpA family protein [Alphaproteobacteria bacterium]
TPSEGPVAATIDFLANSATLSPAAEERLRTLARQLANNEQRMQLKAFAAGGSDNISASRRLSLSRALAVRQFLIDQGLRSTRIDVRALGVAGDSGQPDRVDVVLLR